MPTPTAGASRPFGPRETAALVVFTGVVAVQVTVPALQLGPDPGGRFGWQMFASVEVAPSYAVRFTDGREERVRVEDHVARVRGDIDLADVLPEHLCRRLDNAATVVVEWPGAAGRIMEHPCG